MVHSLIKLRKVLGTHANIGASKEQQGYPAGTPLIGAFAFTA
jgi:hypothetical protein